MIFIIEQHISGFDFDPLGASVASIDDHGTCLISDIDTNEYRYHIGMGGGWGNLLVFQMLFRYELAPIQIDIIQFVNFALLLAIIQRTYMFSSSQRRFL